MDLTPVRRLASVALVTSLAIGASAAWADAGGTAGATVALASPTPSASAAVPEPGVRPEGTILFLRTSGNDDHAYYIANADGTDERQLIQAGDYCCNDRISPDRSQIIVMPGGEPPTPITGGLLSIDAATFTPLHLDDPTLNLVPEAWSPDGTRIAFDGWDFSDPSRTGLYTGTSGDVTDVVRLTSRNGSPLDVALDYSPDGSMLVFYRAVRGEPDFPIDTDGSLWVVNVDGSHARQLDTPPPNWWARWSPDGTTILFVSERLQPTGAIFTIRPDGSGLTTVFEDPGGGFPIDPIWSPDGSQIMFMLDPISDRFTHPNNVLYVMRSDGTGLTKLIDTPDFKSSPEWWSP